MMHTEVVTESGTRYELRTGGDTGFEMRRHSADGEMRGDRTWLKVYYHEAPKMGEAMVLVLEGLGDLPYTQRTTTPVVSIKEKS